MAKRGGSTLVTDNHIIVDNVSKYFVSEDLKTITKAIDSVDLKIKRGEFICLVGASGCGKSTLLRMISGLEKPTVGKIYFDGEEVVEPSPKRGFMLQESTLFNWMDVWSNISFGPKMQKNYKDMENYIQELIELVGLEDFSKSYPSELSGGMAQRVALARALAGGPEALFLDEPLGALDAFTRMNIQRELLGIWQKNKSTMIMVTHDVEEAVFLSNRVIIMSPRPGRIKDIVSIDLKYPRDRNSDEFFSYRNMILEKLNVVNESKQIS